MKTSLTRLSSSFFLASLSLAAWAKPVAQVVEVSGTVFMVGPDGKTSSLKLNQHVEDKSEIMVEEGGAITLNDYYDATYHLTGGSHLKFFDKSVQLKRGKTWIESMNSRYPLSLTTANGQANFWKGEFITTFDQGTSRSQFLVVNGEVEVSNILDSNAKFVVPAGSFTTVDPEVENGVPRVPTKVGLASLEQSLAEFKKLPSKVVSPGPKRDIASVKPEETVKKGEIIFIQSTRMPASVSTDLAHRYMKKLPVKKEKLSPVQIKIYGTSWQNTAPATLPRAPASVQVVAPVMPKISLPNIKNDPEFAESLKKHTSEQPKHSKELENLIQDLKSY